MKPVNDPPIANPDSAAVNEDDPAGVTFNVLSNDTDVDSGDSLSVATFDASTIVGGTLTDNGGGSFTYVPGAASPAARRSRTRSPTGTAARAPAP